MYISSFAGKIIIFWKRFCVSKVVNIKSSSLIELFGAYLVLLQRTRSIHTWFVQIFVSTVTYIIWKKIVSSSKRKFTKEKRADVGTSLFMTVNVANCENDSMSSTQQLLNVVYSYKMKPQQKPPSSRMDKFGSYHYHP